MQRGVIALVLVALVGGCATSGSSSRQSYPELLEAWVGATEKELIRIWGLPDQAEPLSGGDRAFIYVKEHTYSLPEPRAASPGIGFPELRWRFHHFCKTIFYLNPEGIIKRAEFQGNHCQMFKVRY
jgi:hypothetical protein